MKRVSAVAVFLAVLVAVSSGAYAATRHTGLGVRLLDAPSDLIKDPRAHSYVIDSLAPGAHITRHIEVYNDTGAAATVQLYAGAATVQAGTFSPTAGRTQNELSSWTTVRPANVALQQGGHAVATVDVRVPSDATRGERYAVVYAEIPGGKTAGGVSIATRAGVRMYVYVGHGAPPPSDFAIQTMTASRSPAGNPVVQSSVKNIGGRALDMTGSLWLRKGPGGLSAGPFPVRVGTTLGVGQTEPVNVILDKSLPAGPWLAHLQLQSDLIKHAAEATITFPTVNGTSAHAVRAHEVPLTKNRNVLVPLAIGFILALLVGLILFLFWKRRRRREDEDEETPAGGAPPTIPGQRASHEDALRRLRR